MEAVSTPAMTQTPAQCVVATRNTLFTPMAEPALVSSLFAPIHQQNLHLCSIMLIPNDFYCMIRTNVIVVFAKIIAIYLGFFAVNLHVCIYTLEGAHM